MSETESSSVETVYKTSDNIKVDNKTTPSKSPQEIKQNPPELPTDNKSPTTHKSPGNDLTRFLLATTLINDAIHNRLQIPYKENSKSLKLYHLYYSLKFQWLYYFFAVVIMSLIIFEEPRLDYFKMPIYLFFPINIISLAFCFFRWYHHFSISDWELFKENKLYLLVPIVLVFMIIDSVVYMVFQCLKLNYPGQYSRFLRPILLIGYPENFKIRTTLYQIWITTLDISMVFAMLVFSLIFFAIIAFQFFRLLNIELPDGTKYFGTVWESIYQVYILITTANSPDVIVPAYEKHTVSIVVYIVITIFCNWILTGILIGSIYNAYKANLGLSFMSRVTAKKEKLTKAFHILKDEGEAISEQSFLNVMNYIQPNSSDERNNLLFRLLDINKSGNLNKYQFLKLTEFLPLRFTEIVINRESIKLYVPIGQWFYTSRYNNAYIQFISMFIEKIIGMIRHRFTQGFFDILIILNAFIIVFATGTNYELILEWFFTLIFTVEMGLQIFALGINNFLSDYWNIFDVVVVFLAFLSLIIHSVLVSMRISLMSPFVLKLILTLRILRILKLINFIRPFRKILNCIMMLIPSLSYYAGVLIIIYYMYTCIGMALFANVYREPFNHNYDSHSKNNTCGNSYLENSDFKALHYCIFNFNSVFDGYLLMLILTVSNNWHILASGVTLTKGAGFKLFFISIHVSCVLIVMNTILAFIIDAYLMENQQQEKCAYEGFIEKRLRQLNLSVKEELEKVGIKNFGNAYFTISHEQLEEAFPTKNQVGQNNPSKVCFSLDCRTPKSLDALLQRMFHDDLELFTKEYKKYDFSIDVLVQSLTNNYSHEYARFFNPKATKKLTNIEQKSVNIKPNP